MPDRPSSLFSPLLGSEVSLIYSSPYHVEGPYVSYKEQQLIEEFERHVKCEVRLSINIYVTDVHRAVRQFILNDLRDFEFKITSSFNIVAYDRDLLISAWIDSSDPFEKVNRTCRVTLQGSYAAVEKTYTRLRIHQQNIKESLVHLWFLSTGALKQATFSLNTNTDVFQQEYVPWIDDIDDFVTRFVESKANILILLGQPGTGKTSFIRHLLKSNNAHCYTTYDQKIMENDELYINFLNENGVKFLILEDSDLLLLHRVKDRNQVMSQMLNASDGLASFKEKKIIFTANIENKDKIDEALIRPGRCFSIQRFRSLKYEEAIKAAAVGNCKLPEPNREYTLAELFNR